MTSSSLGIDHLTALDLAPETFVGAAADAGFTSVSLRTIHIDGGEPAWAGEQLHPTAIVRAGGGMRVHAIEAVALTPRLALDLDRLRPHLELGAELGAEFLYCFADDADVSRMADHFALLAATAREHGLRTLIEPMPYRSVATLEQAAELAVEVPDAGLVIDTLHASRGGAAPARLAELPERLLAVLQLCDAPMALPQAPSPSGLDPRLHEARFNRLVPGAGELPLPEFLREMPAHAVLTVEAPAPADGLDPQTRLRRVLLAVQALCATTERGAR